MQKYESSLGASLNDLVNFVPPVALPVAQLPGDAAPVAQLPGVAAVPGVAQEEPVAGPLPESPPSPAPEESVMITGMTAATGTAGAGTTGTGGIGGRVALPTAGGMVAVDFTAPHTQATLSMRELLHAHRRTPTTH